MNKNIFKILISILILSTYSLYGYSEEIVHYENLPVTINLQAGNERSIQFGDHVKVGVTQGQKAKNLFRVQSAQGAVHFLAYEEFGKQRVQIKRISDGRVILLDLISVKSKAKSEALENIRIIIDTENVVDENDKEESINAPEVAVISPVDLTRYASQILYGPSRLHREIQGISSTSLGVDGYIKVFKGENSVQVSARPISAIRGGGYSLASIYIKNITQNKITLNYLNINVPFTHATFQHHTLKPNGTPGDSTVLYLVTDKNLKEALYPWSYYEELSLNSNSDKNTKK